MEKIENLLKGIKKNVPLKDYTTFKIGGPARYFFAAQDKKDLISAIKGAQKLKIPFFILGGGSNLLVADKGYRGLVIKTGKPLSSYVPRGLEHAAGIPGTIEGAVHGNAGSFEKSMKDIVESVEVFDSKTQKIKVFKNKDCHFAYRDSVFKRNKNLVILSVKIKSKKSNLQRIKKYLNYKKETQPLGFPSAGSVFKNPKGYFAGELIEKCGLKGKRIGRAEISKKHANFIVNLGGARAKDVIKLINSARKLVKNKFGVDLEEEIEYLGFEN